MKFFVDTADTNEIRDLAATGLLDGVTTNPSLIHKSGRKFVEVVEEICAIVDGPVSAEVVALDHETMMKEAAVLRKIADNVCIKVPLTIDGLKTCKALTSEGVQVNVTLCFSANQALLAAKAGATFISPFVGRHDDNGFDGMKLIEDIRLIYDNYAFDTEIDPCAGKREDRCGRNDGAAFGHQGAVQPCADRQGHCGVPGGLGEDRAVGSLSPTGGIPSQPLTRCVILSMKERCDVRGGLLVAGASRKGRSVPRGMAAGN